MNILFVVSVYHYSIVCCGREWRGLQSEFWQRYHLQHEKCDTFAQTRLCGYVCVYLQSGSSAVLERMRRGYTREAYLDLVERIRTLIPDVTISSDFIAGFCGETERDHRDTVSLMEKVLFHSVQMFSLEVGV